MELKSGRGRSDARAEYNVTNVELITRRCIRNIRIPTDCDVVCTAGQVVAGEDAETEIVVARGPVEEGFPTKGGIEDICGINRAATVILNLVTDVGVSCLGVRWFIATPSCIDPYLNVLTAAIVVQARIIADKHVVRATGGISTCTLTERRIALACGRLKCLIANRRALSVAGKVQKCLISNRRALRTVRTFRCLV